MRRREPPSAAIPCGTRAVEYVWNVPTSGASQVISVSQPAVGATGSCRCTTSGANARSSRRRVETA